LRPRRTDTLQELLDVLRSSVGSFKPQDTSQALHRLALLSRAAAARAATAAGLSRSSSAAPPPAAPGAVAAALALLEERLVVGGHAAELDAWGTALAVWSCGALGQAPEPLLAALARRTGEVLPCFKPIDCASALVGWAWLGARGREQRQGVDAVVARSFALLEARPREWRPQELANVAWALSRVGAAGTDRQALLEALAGAVQRRVDAFNMQVGGERASPSVAARARHPGPPPARPQHPPPPPPPSARADLHPAPPLQELSTLVYAFARIHHRAPAALEAIAARVARQPAQLAPQDASMLLWGFAKLGFKPGAALLDALPSAVIKRLADFKPQVCEAGVAATSWWWPLRAGVAQRCLPHALPDGRGPGWRTPARPPPPCAVQPPAAPCRPATLKSLLPFLPPPLTPPPRSCATCCTATACCATPSPRCSTPLRAALRSACPSSPTRTSC
jgi:hypothetical protein